MKSSAKPRRLRVGLSVAVMLGVAGISAGTISSASATDSSKGHHQTCNDGSDLYVPPSVPTEFDPFSATAEELDNYGIPPKPTDATMLSAWTAYVKHDIKHVDKCATSNPHKRQRNTAAATPHATGPGACGYDRYSSWFVNGHGYRDIEASFTVPTVTADGTNNTDRASHWAGIGLGYSYANPIFQAGVDTNWVAGHTEYAMWAEFYAQNGQCTNTGPYLDWQSSTVAGLYVNAGDSVYVHVNYTNGVAQYHVVNYTRNENVTVSKAPPSGSTGNDGHAEWVTERGSSRLAHFGTVTFTGAHASFGSGWTSGGNLPNYSAYMTDDSGVDEVSYPSSWHGTSLDSFTNNWLAYY